MKTVKSFILVSTMFLAGRAAAEDANALANGHFEDGKLDWSVMNHVAICSDGHDSARSLELRSTDQELVRGVTAVTDPPQSGVLRLWYFCPDKEVSASQLVVAIIPEEANGVEIPDGRRTFVLDRVDDEKWHEFVSEFNLPGDTKSAVLRVSLNETEVEGSAKGATIYQIDDVVITAN